MSELNFTISNGPTDEVKVFHLSGEMDESSIESFKSSIEVYFEDANIKTIIFDLSDLEFINSKGIGYLVYVHTHLAKNSKDIILSSAKENVMDIISLVGLTTIIEYTDTLEEALKKI